MVQKILTFSILLPPNIPYNIQLPSSLIISLCNLAFDGPIQSKIAETPFPFV